MLKRPVPVGGHAKGCGGVVFHSIFATSIDGWLRLTGAMVEKFSSWLLACSGPPVQRRYLGGPTESLETPLFDWPYRHGDDQQQRQTD